eukprot:1184772-Prorocentrum_minimum.AAC.4
MERGFLGVVLGQVVGRRWGVARVQVRVLLERQECVPQDPRVLHPPPVKNKTDLCCHKPVSIFGHVAMARATDCGGVRQRFR